MRPDSSIFLPLLVLFVSSLNGATVHEALRTAFALFTKPGPGLLVWLMVVGLNFLLYAYFAPIFKVHISCMRACEPPALQVDRAMQRLNRMYAWTIGVSILVFVAGKTLMFLLGGRDDGRTRLGELPLQLGEAAIGGYFVGVILSLQFERRLYEARQTILHLGTRVPIAYTSLFSRIIMILVAILLLMTLEAFTFAGAMRGPDTVAAFGAVPQASGPTFLTAPDLLFHARQSEGLRNALNVFFLKLVLLAGFFMQMLWQLKRIIARPLETILESLASLNAPDHAGTKTIDIIHNDEYAPVYREINALILRKQGQLDVSRKRLEDIIELAEDPIIAFGSDRRIRIFNPAAEAIFKCSKDRALGSPIDDFLEGGGADPALPREGEARPVWRDAEGGSLLLESHVSSGEGATWTTVILHDISKQAEIESTLRTARVEAENASRMKSEFLANMSHELRTPLNAILGFTQLLGNDRNLTEGQRERIRVITRSGEHLLSLINDILDISKIEAGKMELHTGVFDLHEFIGDLEDMFSQRCRKKGLSLYVERLEGLPRYVRGDLGKLRQVMINLVGNAVKFTDEGGIGILAGGEAGAVRFAVRDTGRGIPEAELDLIMRPFVQASTTDHEGGTGLGLAISNSFIAMMGGKLEVQSTLGEGSVFSFILPLEASSDAPAPDADADLDIRVEVEGGARVLVVDDQESNRLVLREMLERVGFLVDEAQDGKEAFARAVEVPPAIVFMDIKMPVMDGYEAVALFKKDPRTRAAMVFALTASAFSHDEARIDAAGFDGFLAKPFKQSSLYRLVAERGGVPVVTKRTAGGRDAETPGAPEPGDFGNIGEETRRGIEGAALINDFASLAALAESVRGVAPRVAAALEAAAASYDEAAVEKIMVIMRNKGDGDGR